jgi:hypothetical protein
MFLLAVFRIFSRDNNYSAAALPQKNVANRIASVDIGGGIAGPRTKPKK